MRPKTVPLLSYTENEIRSYLPTGWDILGDIGAWDPKKKVWRTRVVDGVEFDWPLEVEVEDARKNGRLEALRRAFDRLYRERLG